jgi:hypothetical protein
VKVSESDLNARGGVFASVGRARLYGLLPDAKPRFAFCSVPISLLRHKGERVELTWERTRAIGNLGDFSTGSAVPVEMELGSLPGDGMSTIWNTAR